MLVLRRKQGEQIAIEPNVIVTVVKVQGQRVRLGIDAQSDVLIQRAEILPQHDLGTTTQTSPSLVCDYFV